MKPVADTAGVDLPDTGALYLFYDVLAECWGFDPDDAIGFKVLYAPDISTAVTAQRPAFVEQSPTYDEIRIEPALRFEHSPPEGIHFEALSIPEADKDRYRQFDEHFEDYSLADDQIPSGHKLLGWADALQNPMEKECALVTSGIDCGGPEGYNSPEGKRILAEPND